MEKRDSADEGQQPAEHQSLERQRSHSNTASSFQRLPASAQTTDSLNVGNRINNHEMFPQSNQPSRTYNMPVTANTQPVAGPSQQALTSWMGTLPASILQQGQQLGLLPNLPPPPPADAPVTTRRYNGLALPPLSSAIPRPSTDTTGQQSNLPAGGPPGGPTATQGATQTSYLTPPAINLVPPDGGAPIPLLLAPSANNALQVSGSQDQSSSSQHQLPGTTRTQLDSPEQRPAKRQRNNSGQTGEGSTTPRRRAPRPSRARSQTSGPGQETPVPLRPRHGQANSRSRRRQETPDPVLPRPASTSLTQGHLANMPLRPSPLAQSMVNTSDSERGEPMEIDQSQIVQEAPIQNEQPHMYGWYTDPSIRWYVANAPEGYFPAQLVQPRYVDGVPQRLIWPTPTSDHDRRVLANAQAHLDRQVQSQAAQSLQSLYEAQSIDRLVPVDLVQGPLTYTENREASLRDVINGTTNDVPGDLDSAAPHDLAFTIRDRWTDELARGGGCWVPWDDVH